MKVIMVTGGNRGIGREVCRQLAAMGHSVILCSRDVEKGQAAAATMSGHVKVCRLDVTDEESILHAFEWVQAEFGKLDVLINNAGVGSGQGKSHPALSRAKRFFEKRMGLERQVNEVIMPLLRKAGIAVRNKGAVEVSLSQVREVMETNFYGPWRMIQVFVPLLAKSDDPRIINMSSGMGELNSLTGILPGYSLSKAALNALTITFSNELKDAGFRINAMCPGWVRTDMGGPNAPKDVSEGADTAVWLATTNDIPTGKFFKDRNEINW